MSRVLRAGDHSRMPWANAGGTTYQVAAGPDGADLDSFDWRLSLADVDAGGPFSCFPGVERILMVVDGEGMELEVDGRLVPLGPLDPVQFDGAADTELEVDGRLVPLGPLDPVQFDGAADTSCTLTSGPTRDLNLMTRRGRCTGSVHVLTVTGEVQVHPVEGGTVLVVLLSGTASVDGLDLAPRDTIEVEGTTALRGAATAALVTIRPAGTA